MKEKIMDKKIKLMLWHWGRRGGGPRYTLELAKELAKNPQIELYLSLSKQSEFYKECMELNLPGFYIDTYTSMFSAVVGLLKIPVLRVKFRTFLKQNKINVVNCTMGHIWNVAFVSILKRAGAKYIFTVHDAMPHPGEDNFFLRWYLRKNIDSSNGIIALTNHVRQQLQSYYNYNSDKCWVIPHGVFEYSSSEVIQRKFPENKSRKLLFFGRILPYKGLNLLLGAFKVLKDNYPNLELSVVGPGDASLYLETISNTQGVFLDNRWIPEEEIELIFKEADILVNPYIEASQSGVIAIAMGMGIPVVATPVGGLKEQVANGETGLLTKDVSVESLVESISELLKNKDLYEKCSANSIIEVKNKLSWNVIASSVLEVVKKVID